MATRLEKVIEQEVSNILNDLQALQLVGEVNISETRPAFSALQSPLSPDLAVKPDEPQAVWYKPFLISSVCRADLKGIIPDETIVRLDNGDMERIADKMSDAHRDSGGYWEALEFNVQALLERRAQQEQESKT